MGAAERVCQWEPHRSKTNSAYRSFDGLVARQIEHTDENWRHKVQQLNAQVQQETLQAASQSCWSPALTPAISCESMQRQGSGSLLLACWLACCFSRSLRPGRGWRSPRRKVRCSSTVRSIWSTNICGRIGKEEGGVGGRSGAQLTLAVLLGSPQPLPPPTRQNPPSPHAPAGRCCLGAPPTRPAASCRAQPSPPGTGPAARPWRAANRAD